MTPPSQNEATQLLLAWSDGDKAALEELTPLVYAELRRLAERHMRRERAGHPLQTTALVNEAYVRLVDLRQVRWRNRAHFFGVAAQLMRHILVDFARARLRAERGGYKQQVSLEEAAVVSKERSADFIALDDALKSLAEIDSRKSRMVELRFFRFVQKSRNPWRCQTMTVSGLMIKDSRHPGVRRYSIQLLCSSL